MRSISKNGITRSLGSTPHQELAVSRDRGVNARASDVANVRELEASTFDTLVTSGNNFGLVGTRGTTPRILGELAAVTSDEACLPRKLMTFTPRRIQTTLPITNQIASMDDYPAHYGFVFDSSGTHHPGLTT